MKINTAVVARLAGYAIIIVWKVLSFGNTAYTQAILTPHTPRIVRMAGTVEMPKPLRYPDITSYNILNRYAIKISTSLV